MRLLVLGASGGIGQHLLRLATERGHEVTAFVRSPQKVALKSEKLKVIPGDVFNTSQLAGVLPGHDAVLSAFGPTTLRRVTTRGDFGQSVATAMQQSGVRRVLAVSSAMLFKDIGFVGGLLRGLIFRNIGPDMAEMEAAFRTDGLEWMIVRPPRLTNGERTESYHVAEGKLPRGGFVVISRLDVADFMVKEAERPAHSRQIVGVCQ